ncbi:ROK family glucokinase [Ornithinimicrobium cerasi]|uniref:ROK family glucokinase n=1 Tax=Ornithinimicrobium cerasi TaxID=2248773 RepID=UPI000EFF4C40|nr:ROK family glucokinase [Ornithinimicrobium cerasi]
MSPAPTAPRAEKGDDPSLVVGVDVGGTHVKAGLVTATGDVLGLTRTDTSRSSEGLVDVVVGVVDGLLTAARGRQVVAVGVGAAGLVDHARGVVVLAPHLPWRDEPLRDRLEGRLRLPVVVDNDANAAARAEHRFGAGRGEPDLLLVTLGTGIGGAHLVDGRVQRGRHGLAGEYGHMTVVPDGRACPCGRRGCWEQYASGSVLGRAAEDLVRQGRPGTTMLRELCGGDAARLRGEHVTRAGLAGDPLAADLLAEVGRWLGHGLANLTSALDPGVVVVGGGVVAAGDLLLGPARRALAERLPGTGHRPVPPVRPALLGNTAGLVGAADLAREAGG